MLSISAHSIGMKASSIHLSFVASRWGHPTGRGWVSSHSIEAKSSLDSWSVFLQDGVTLVGSDSTDLISSEGITTVGLLGAFFRAFLGVSLCHPGAGRSALKLGGAPHSVVFTSGEDSVSPSRQRRSLSQSSIGMRALTTPSWCLVGAFAMRSPLWVESFSDLDRNEDSSCIFPRVWCQALAMGSPVSGRVEYFCALDRNEGFFHPSILRCFAMGSSYGSRVGFLPLDRSKVFFG